MSDIRIEWLSDSHDCETCGSSWASGARVWFDGELALNLEPSACCYDGTDYSETEVFSRILSKLGHNLSEVTYA